MSVLMLTPADASAVSAQSTARRSMAPHSVVPVRPAGRGSKVERRRKREERERDEGGGGDALWWEPGK